MRACSRRLVAPLFMAAAVFSAVAPAPFASAAVHQVKFISRACPAGTNWDNATHSCVP